MNSFSAHGINEGALRHRVQSKAIDDQTIKRVLTDFGPHDKLSEKQLASLDELVTKAHKLHVHKDDQGAERLYRQVVMWGLGPGRWVRGRGPPAHASP